MGLPLHLSISRYKRHTAPMRNLIYQYWDGTILTGVRAGSKVMKEYADRIGCEYLFEENPRFVTHLGHYSPHYGQFKVIYDAKFEEYDNIMFADTDVFPVEGLSENIFDHFNSHIGICEETYQPQARLTSSSEINSRMDNKWCDLIQSHYKLTMPRTPAGLPRVFNSGMVLYSKEGRKLAKETFRPFLEYTSLVVNNGLPNFYTADQNYIHAMMHSEPLKYQVMSGDWNSFVHYIGNSNMVRRPVNDMRTPTSKFIHIQLRAADHYDEQKLRKIANTTNVEDWGIYQ